MFLKFEKPNLFLYFCAASVNLTSFIIGCCFAWTSPAIPRLNGSVEPKYNPLGSDATLTSSEESWIASLVPLGAAASSLISGYLADKRGRKEVLVISSLLTIIGFGIMHFADAVAYICLARFVCGLGIGIIFTVIPMYIGEIAEDTNRGILGIFMVLFVMIGILFTYGIGSAVTLNQLNLINFAAPLLFLIVFDWFMPESPHWLVRQNRLQDAKKSLGKLRLLSEEKLVMELEAIKKHVNESFRTKGSIKDLFCKKELSKALLLTCGLIFFQQLTGINIILFYMQPILEETGSSIPADLSTIIIGIVQVAACLLATILVDNLGRKILLLFSGLGETISLVAFGVYFYLKETGRDVDNIFWLPIVSIMCFMISYSVGFGPIPFVVLSEVFPPQEKGLASTITICLCLLGTFFTTTVFPIIITYIGMAYAFWILALCCFISIIFVYVFLSETKGRSLAEIQEILKK